MPKVGTILAVLALALVVTGARAATTEEIVGSWVVEKGEGGPPKGTVIDFTKDGKFKATVKDGTKEEIIEGTWKVDKETLTLTFKGNDKEDLKIKEATKDKLVVESDKGKTTELKKK